MGFYYMGESHRALSERGNRGLCVTKCTYCPSPDARGQLRPFRGGRHQMHVLLPAYQADRLPPCTLQGGREWVRHQMHVDNYLRPQL